MTDVAVRQVTPADVDELAELLDEMDRFYAAVEAQPLDQRRREIRDALFSDDPAGHAVIAHVLGRPVGFGTYSFLWPAAGLTRSLFLKELFVTAAARNQGTGRALMDAIVSIATRRGCSRVEWMTDRPNTQARRFYDRLGVTPDGTKVFYRVQGSALGPG